MLSGAPGPAPGSPGSAVDPATVRRAGAPLDQTAQPGPASNRFAQRAQAYTAGAQARAQRIAAAWDERPAGSVEPSGEQLARMWGFSPSTQPESDFWALHDHVLAQTGDPQQAEQAALQAVYPYRAQLLQDLAPQVAVKRANQLHQAAQRQTAQRHADTPTQLTSHRA